MIGAIFLRTERDAEPFSDADVRFCQMVASLTAKALRNAHRFETLLRSQKDVGVAQRNARAAARRARRLPAPPARPLRDGRGAQLGRDAAAQGGGRGARAAGDGRDAGARGGSQGLSDARDGDGLARAARRRAARAARAGVVRLLRPRPARRSPTPSTTGCSASCRRSSASIPTLRTADSPTQRVGAEPASAARQAHAPRADALARQRVQRGGARRRGRSASRASSATTRAAPATSAELKIDGAAVSLTYRERRVRRRARRAATASSARTSRRTCARMRDVPLRLRGDDVPPLIEIRGEVYMPFSRLRADERGARRRGRAGVRQSAQLRGRRAAPARSRRSPRSARCASSATRSRCPTATTLPVRDAVGAARHARRVGHSRRAASAALRDAGRGARVGARRRARRARGARLRDRRRRGQGRRAARCRTSSASSADASRAGRSRASSRPTSPRRRCSTIQVNVGRTGALNPFAVLEPVEIGGTHGAARDAAQLRSRSARRICASATSCR